MLFLALVIGPIFSWGILQKMNESNPKIMEKLITKGQVYIHKYVMRRMENNPLDFSHYAYVVKEY